MAYASTNSASARFVERLVLDQAQIRINGKNTWDPHIVRSRMFNRVLLRGSLGLGESYMDGDWDCEDLVQFFVRVLTSPRTALLQIPETAVNRVRMFFNLQTKERARQVIDVHYDMGNDLYASFLCPKMVYTCAYWKNARTLEEAQLAKLDLVCRKAGIRPAHRVLDIGGGFGSFGMHAAHNYKASVVVTSLSKQQTAYAQSHIGSLPVELRLEDYRDTVGPDVNDSHSRYDRLVSIGMFEAVGRANLTTFFRKARSLLKDDGVFVLHTIISNTNYGQSNPWLDKYIFPNGYLPPNHELLSKARKYFKVADIHMFGADYARTLREWRQNFVRNYDALSASNPRYDRSFYRMMLYYFAQCEAAFTVKRVELAQYVLVPHENQRSLQIIR